MARSRRAVDISRDLVRLGDDWRARLTRSNGSPAALRLADVVLQHPPVNARLASAFLERAGRKVTMPAVLAKLVETGILTERTSRARDQIWMSEELTALLDPERN